MKPARPNNWLSLSVNGTVLRGPNYEWRGKAGSDPFPYLTTTDRGLVLGLAATFVEASDAGKLLYQVTTTYRRKVGPISQSYFDVIDHQDFRNDRYRSDRLWANENLRRFHLRLLGYLAGNRAHITRPWFRKIEPKLYCFVDVPWSKIKHDKPEPIPSAFSDAHHHSFVLADPQHQGKFDALADPREANEMVQDSGRHCSLSGLHVRKVSEDVKSVVNAVS